MKLTLFGVKSTMILNDVIVKVDTIISHINSTGYSFWSSDLNQTTRIAWSPHHVPYSVTLGTKGVVISHLCTRVRFPPKGGLQTAISSTRGRPLYPTFVVYLRTIHGPLSFISYHHPEGLLSLNG